MSDKDKIAASFKQLRKEGFFARMNFLCCQSCAWAGIPEGQSTNVVFYHKQSARALDKYGRLDQHGMHLYHGGNSARIYEVLRENGLNVEWNGKPDAAILVRGAANV